jgi:hypothetical protein
VLLTNAVLIPVVSAKTDNKEEKTSKKTRTNDKQILPKRI